MRKGKKIGYTLVVLTALVVLCVSAYFTLAYSQIEFIAKWRALWIETAMTTDSHQWLARIFPQDVIDEVMSKDDEWKKKQSLLSSSWDSLSFIDVVYGQVDEQQQMNAVLQEKEDFFARYPEIDTEEMRRYLAEHPELRSDGYGSIQIEDMEEELGLLTKQGHPILVLDAKNGILIVKVSGTTYEGKLAIIKDSANTELVKSAYLGSRGQEAADFGASEDALLVVNMSGFSDAKGSGSGGQVKGSLVIDGVEYGDPTRESHWRFCGLQTDNKLYVGNYPKDNLADYRWGVEFYPAVIVNGESVVDGSYCMGLQPRTVIGQSTNGDMLLLVIDGRQIGYSLGCTVADCADILKGYDAYQAMNVDGGSSSVMWYNGEYITKSSSVSGRGRYMPDALIVRRNP